MACEVLRKRLHGNRVGGAAELCDCEGFFGSAAGKSERFSLCVPKGDKINESVGKNGAVGETRGAFFPLLVEEDEGGHCIGPSWRLS